LLGLKALVPERTARRRTDMTDKEYLVPSETVQRLMVVLAGVSSAKKNGILICNTTEADALWHELYIIQVDQVVTTHDSPEAAAEAAVEEERDTAGMVCPCCGSPDRNEHCCIDCGCTDPFVRELVTGYVTGDGDA